MPPPDLKTARYPLGRGTRPAARDRAGRFRPGGSGNPRGRPVGTQNRATAEVRDLARRILEDETYRAQLYDAAIKGKLPPVIEVMLWAYAYGKPRERVEVSAVDGYSGLTDEELRDRVIDHLGRLEGVRPPCERCPFREAT